MRKRNIALLIGAFALVFTACKKDNDNSANARTVDNLSGSYLITAATVTALGITFDEYKTWDACQKDNIIKLNQDLTANFIDTGIVCDPPMEASGNWALTSNNDSLTVSGIPGLPTPDVSGGITSWDGKTLVLTGTQEFGGQTSTIKLTLFKQ